MNPETLPFGIQKLGLKLDNVLHRFSIREEDKSSNSDLFLDIASLSQTVETMAEMATRVGETEKEGQKTCGALPVKVLEELRVLGSACWNMTVRHVTRQDDPEERILRASLREFASKAFLLGNYAYSPKDISHSYFTHHPREAEQCVLMCLKTARDLSLCSMGESSKKLLVVGETVASFIRSGVQNSLTHLKYRNMRWEFAYTNMEVTWNVGHYQESCQAAEKLVQILLQDNSLLRDHREAFFRFVFTIGNTTVSMSEEQHIRTLLQFSIDVQTHFKEVGTGEPPHHLTVLYGATVEQMALSCLREGKKTEAVRWALEADTALHSNTSALLRLKSTAEANMEAEAVSLLYQYVQRSDVSVDDAVAACFELHKLLVNAKEGPIEGMRLLYNRVKGSTSNESVLFRFVQLLLHDGGLSSCKEALQILKKEGIDFEEAKYRRYSFMWLWELSDMTEFTCSQIIASLEGSLQFKDCASDSEVDSVHLRLCAEYITDYEDGKRTNALMNAKNILLKHTERKSRCAFAHCLLFKIAVLEESEVELEKELNFLLACEPIELVMPAICTVINYSLKRGYYHGVSLVAARAVSSSFPMPNIQTEFELLRVYVASILNKACSCTNEQLSLVGQRFRDLGLNENTTMLLNHEEVTWWAQAFLLLGSEFTDRPGPTSILLFRVAMHITLQDPTPDESPSRAFLTAGLLCSLEDEFQMFTTGCPQMTPHELGEQLRICREFFVTRTDAEYRVTVLLSEAEYFLRQPSAETPEKIQTVVEDLSNVSLAFEDYEALADGASSMAIQHASEYPLLHGVALGLHMKAAEVVMNTVCSAMNLAGDDDDDEKSMGYITSALSSLYKSFTLAFDRKEQMVVIHRLMELLSLSVENVTVDFFIKRYHADGVKTVVSHAMSFVVLFLEYFTVEAWNNSVFYLHLTETVKQTEWVHIAWALVNILPPTNSVASALLSLKAITSL